MNLRIIKSLKIDFRADWTHESNPTVWELIQGKCQVIEYRKRGENGSNF